MIEIRELYEKMYQEMGPQGWWPANTKIEIILGAILVQNTNWQNVEKSLTNLKKVTEFKTKRILELTESELEELIRPSGFYKNKGRSIRETLKWFEQYQWHDTGSVNQDANNLRLELLKLPGVGEETADVFLVYLFEQVEFIADNYARKLFKALGYLETNNYAQLKAAVQLPKDFTNLEAQEFHGLIDEFGKKYLKKSSVFEESFLGEYQKKA